MGRVPGYPRGSWESHGGAHDGGARLGVIRIELQVKQKSLSVFVRSFGSASELDGPLPPQEVSGLFVLHLTWYVL